MDSSWKYRLFASYVSSGQAAQIASNAPEQFAPQAPYIRRFVRKHIPRNTDARIVDLGCGHGAFLYFLEKEGYSNIEGVDGSLEQVNLSRRLGLKTVQHCQIRSYLVQVRDDSVDVVLLMDVLEHLDRQELFDTLDQTFRILRPGGKIIAHVPNAAGIFGMQIRYGDLTHELAFTPKSSGQAFSAVGFNNVRCFEDKPVIHGALSAIRWVIWQLGTVPFRSLVAAETGRFSVVLSQNMVITATKP